MSTESGKRVRVGRIVGLHGVQGQVKLESWTEPRLQIFRYQPWLLSAPGVEREMSGIRGNAQGKGMVATLPGITDRDQAAALVGCEITVSRDTLPPPSPGEFYWTDLEGLEVVTTEDAILGRVSHLFATGANDVMVVKEGDHLDLGDQHLIFHHHPGHTPGVLTTEGIKVYDGGKPYTAILMGGGGYRGGLKEAEQSVQTANQVAAIKGVQVNLQIHSWAEPNGYPGGGVLERGLRLKSRKAGDTHPFVDPATFTQWVKRARANAAKAVEEEKQKAKK